MSSDKITLGMVEEHLKEHPNDANAWNMKAVLLAGEEDFGAALRCLETAIRIDSELAAAYTNRGRILMALGPENVQKALESFDKALKLEPANIDALRDKSLALRMLNKPKEELDCLYKITKIVTDDWKLWLRIGDLHLEISEYDKALEYYEKALELESDLPAALLHRAIAFSMLGKWKSAIKSARKATKLAPEDIESWRVLGDVCFRAERYNSAMKALKEAIKLDPRNPSIRNTMGMIAFKDGRLKDAAKHFEHALRVDSEHKDSLRNLGLIYMELEMWEKAAEAWSRFTSLERGFPEPFDALGYCYARLDDFCSAQEAWDRARKLFSKRGEKDDAERTQKLGRAARINCSRQKKAEKARRKHEKSTRSLREALSRRRKGK
ncbi:MAG: tetratricopeptide repeat protein [Candidatus Lokiarchaeota archaeon]|nr:tetratricopeptide repeat protein [Candidatus Lokiarchaeota archaeon]